MPTQHRLPPLNALRAFDAAGRHFNFRLAAEELGVTQSAVAQQVRALEAWLGLRLFDRRPKVQAFTDAGRGYHGEVVKGFAVLADATTRLRPEPSKVTISVTPTFASKWLIPNLPDFTAAHPAIDLRVLATEGLSSFRTDGIDLAVRQGNPPFGASLEARLLFPQEIIAVCAPALVAGARLPLDPEAAARLVLLHDTHNHWPAFFAEVIGTEQAASGKGLRFNQTSLGIDAALAGQGVALGSRFLVARDLAAGRLVQPVTGALRGGQDFYLLAPRSARRPDAVQAVWIWLAGQADGYR